MWLQGSLLVLNLHAQYHVPAECSGTSAYRLYWLQVFVPLARLLGLYSMKQELEELAFQYSEPEAHSLVRSTLQRLQADQQPTVQRVRLLPASLLDRMTG